MNFLKKLFGGPGYPMPGTKESKTPDNTRLNFLLDIHAKHPTNENYHAVLREITHGNSFLLLPTINEHGTTTSWETAPQGTTLNLSSVFNLDGLRVLGAFSEEDALVKWTKRATQYTAIKTQDLVEFCKLNHVDRIVINSDQKNMFVLERNQENITSMTIQEDTTILVGKPAITLPKETIGKLVKNFKNINTIEEAYQYAQRVNNETSLVLGFKMTVVSDNAKTALYNTLNDSLGGIDLGMPIDIFLLEDESWLHTVRRIEGSQFYRK